MPSPDSIKVSVPDTRERKRRQRELFLALGAFLLVVVFTWVELKFLGVNSYLVMGLFNLNFILLLVIVFVVVRNMVKLILERRRKVLGAKLRTRLVLSFMTLSLVPTVLMFVVGVKFVQTSVDFWFKGQVESSLEQALEVGQAFYASSRERLERRGGHIVAQIRERGLAWGGNTMDEFLDNKRGEYDLSLLGVMNSERSEQNWHALEEWGRVWPEVKAGINWKSLQERPEFWSAIRSGPGADMVVGLLPVDKGKTGYLVLGESIGHGLLYKLNRIVDGVEEYKKLHSMKYPMKVALYMILGVVTLLIILGAMWFGLRLAKELSAPVQALAQGTRRIAKGDLSVRLEDQSSDELGFLVRSFNKMAEDLQQSRTGLTEANIRLNRQYAELEQRGTYIEALLDNITAGVISLDGQGRIGTVNKAAEAMLDIN
ncbi:MAG: HAMP domain-containing protein, partial [Thermodesulfobacteriota bacterium]|nr:HAMP domain-containing protein [Thermodesulfobacteriota bacterium]